MLRRSRGAGRGWRRCPPATCPSCTPSCAGQTTRPCGRTPPRARSPTEAAYLLGRHVFDLDYRRYEWKCDALNELSRQAAVRLGFTYEGRFRNAVVVKGRRRDTDSFAITDDEWPDVRAALEAWLDPANHGPRGQRRTLAELREGTPGQA